MDMIFVRLLGKTGVVVSFGAAARDLRPRL
jgi:hypothetical protein